jgi:hypothetical protein
LPLYRNGKNDGADGGMPAGQNKWKPRQWLKYDPAKMKYRPGKKKDDGLQRNYIGLSGE